MINPYDLRNLTPGRRHEAVYSAENVISGIPIPKTKRIELFSADEWEEFTEEWATSLVSAYHHVVRFAGPGDKGLDVVGFIANETFDGGWDNYQCKHYNVPLRPSDIWVEIGKVIYYSYVGEYPVPRKHYFVGSKGIGTTLAKLLANPARLKTEARSNWSQYCLNNITAEDAASLEGGLLSHFEKIDFSIFSSRTAAELIQGHSTTVFHAVRFGGGLPMRPDVPAPPDEIAATESRYIQQIFEAYSDNAGVPITDVETIHAKPELKDDFLRQRERFYHAESLRNFARDTVPEGTFEKLQEDVYHGIVDVCESNHENGLARMRAALSQSATLSLTASPLFNVVRIKDKQGICHQLANVDRLKWVKDDKHN